MNDKTEKPEQLSVECAYSLLRGMRALNKPTLTTKAVIFNDLYLYVMGSDRVDRSAVEQVLEGNEKLKSVYEKMLYGERLFYTQRLVAAESNEHIDQRSGEGFVLKIRESKADSNQYYLILEVDPLLYRKAKRTVVLHACTDKVTSSCVFPALYDGKTQLIVSKGDKLLTLLRESDPEISIV